MHKAPSEELDMSAALLTHTILPDFNRTALGPQCCIFLCTNTYSDSHMFHQNAWVLSIFLFFHILYVCEYPVLLLFTGITKHIKKTSMNLVECNGQWKRTNSVRT